MNLFRKVSNELDRTSTPLMDELRHSDIPEARQLANATDFRREHFWACKKFNVNECEKCRQASSGYLEAVRNAKKAGVNFDSKELHQYAEILHHQRKYV